MFGAIHRVRFGESINGEASDIDGRCHADLLEENGKPCHLASLDDTPHFAFNDTSSTAHMPNLVMDNHRHRRCTTQALVAIRLHWVALVEQSAMQRSRFGSTTKNRARHAATHDSCLSPQSAAPTQAAQLLPTAEQCDLRYYQGKKDDSSFHGRT